MSDALTSTDLMLKSLAMVRNMVTLGNDEGVTEADVLAECQRLTEDVHDPREWFTMVWDLAALVDTILETLPDFADLMDETDFRDADPAERAHFILDGIMEGIFTEAMQHDGLADGIDG